MTKDREQHREWATNLIQSVWLGIDWERVSAGRRRGLYEEYASKIKSAALTSDGYRFFETLCRKMDVRSINNDAVLFILGTANHAVLLDILRTETSLVVLKMRLRQEDKKLRTESKNKTEDNEA